jgi:hypothetical protein
VLDWMAALALGIHNLLEIARRCFEHERGIQLTRQALCKPGIKKPVFAPERYRPRANQRHDLALTDPRKKVIPKRVVEFAGHAPLNDARIVAQHFTGSGNHSAVV